MTRYVIAAAAAALLTAPADAQVVLGSGSGISYYPGSGVVVSGGNSFPGALTYSGSTGLSYSPYSYAGNNLYSGYSYPGSGYGYAPGYSTYSGSSYAYPGYTGSSYSYPGYSTWNSGYSYPGYSYGTGYGSYRGYRGWRR